MVAGAARPAPHLLLRRLAQDASAIIVPETRRLPEARFSIRPDSSSQFSRVTPPSAVLATSLFLTLAAGVLLARTEEARDSARFANAVQSTRDRVESRLSTYTALLRGTAGLFAANDSVTRDAFAEYVSRLRIADQYPGIQGVGFTQRVLNGDLPRFVEAVRASGVASYRVWPDSSRAEYNAILFLEPMDRRNRVALGYDMFTEPVRREAMARARDTGRAALSGKVTLVQEVDERKQAGFLLYLPVYRGGDVPPTFAKRRAALAGFVYAPFRADDLFRGIFGTERAPRVRLLVYDGPRVDEGALLHASSATGPEQRSGRVATEHIAIGGRPWTLVFESTPAFEALGASLVPPLIVAGVLVSLVLFGLARAQIGAKEIAVHAAGELRASLAERERLVLDAQDARRAAEQANRLKSQFLANMSHEIRTPINAVTGYAQLLEMEIAGPLSPQQRAHIERIRFSGQHLLTIVDDVLDLAKVEAGEMAIESRAVSAYASATSAITLVEPQATVKRIALVLGPACEADVTFRGDASRARQILVNLLGNAVKFTEPGGRVTVRCHLATRPDPEAVLSGAGPWSAIEVCDNGVGIAPEEIGLIFEPFVQAEGGYARKQGGSGLGLAISRRLARLMGGDITVRSRLGEGSCFTLWVPAATASSGTSQE